MSDYSLSKCWEGRSGGNEEDLIQFDPYSWLGARDVEQAFLRNVKQVYMMASLPIIGATLIGVQVSGAHPGECSRVLEPPFSQLRIENTCRILKEKWRKKQTISV